MADVDLGPVGPIEGHPDPFTPECITGIVGHMNGDHLDSSLAICRGLGGQPDATGARMATVLPDGAHFVATVGGDEVSVVVPWGTEIVERFDIRLEVERMHRDAHEALGLPLEQH